MYGIVKQSGGFVWVYSEAGQGSTFKIYLPHAAAQDRDTLQPDPLTDSAGGAETILVVEDEPMVRDLACRGLREQGYTVLEAENGAEALERLGDRTNPSIWYLRMWSCPSWAAGTWATSWRGSARAAGALHVRLHGRRRDSAGTARSGAPFQQKPFTPEGLARKVREMLDLRKAREA